MSSDDGSNTAETTSSQGSLLRQTLMNVDEVFVYKIPPLASSGGHRAEQWDLANPLQTCGFQVERRDNDLYLLFTTHDHTKLFALSKLHEQDAAKSIETVMDSSRYFVTKIQNNSSGKTALIGFGFRDRDVAIDLLGNLQQFQKSIAREIQARNLKVAEIPKLAAGEKIRINIGGSGSTKRKSTKAKTSGGPILLKKPPKASDAETSSSAGASTVQPPLVAATTTTTTTHAKPLSADERNVHLSMGEINLNDDHKSVASVDSDVAHANKSIAALDFNDDGDGTDDDWDDFQSA